MNEDFYIAIHRNLCDLILDYELSNRLFSKNSELLNCAASFFTSGYIEAEQLDKIESDYMPIQGETKKSNKAIGKILKAYFAERRNRTKRSVHQFSMNQPEITDADLNAARTAHSFIRSHIAESENDSAYDVELPFAVLEEIKEALDENRF